MKTTRAIQSLALLLCSLLLMVSCGFLPGFITGSSNRGFVAVEFSLIGENTIDASWIKLELHRDESLRNFEKTCQIDGMTGTAYGFIPEVPTGGWEVSVTVFNSAGGVITSDGPGVDVQVLNDEILTLRVQYDPAAGEDLTIDWSSASSVEPAVTIYPDDFDVCLVLHTSGEEGYNVEQVSVMSGSGEFQAASGFSFLYPDGTIITRSTRSIAGETRIFFDDTHFNCTRTGGWNSSGSYEVRVTDLYGVNASRSYYLSLENPEGSLTVGVFPAHGDVDSFDTGFENTVTWEGLTCPDIQSIMVLLVQKSMLSSASPDFISSSLMPSSTSVTIPAGTLMSGTEYELIILAFDRWIDDTSEFSFITNFTAESLMRSIFSSTMYDFDCIGMSYSSFTTM